MSVRRLSEADFGEKIQHFLRPSKPVVEPNMLRGREQQLALIRQALYAEGRSVFIYGERGVGKSSLARIAASQYREGSSEFPYVLCEPNSSLESVLVALARQVGLDGSEEQKRTHRFTARLWKFVEYTQERSSTNPGEKLLSEPSLDSCVELGQEIADALGQRAIAVVDEFDTISDLKERQKLGIRNLVWVLAPWVFVAITFKEWILVLDG